jgi:N-acetylmuramoyl-L-alanine amidase
VTAGLSTVEFHDPTSRRRGRRTVARAPRAFAIVFSLPLFLLLLLAATVGGPTAARSAAAPPATEAAAQLTAVRFGQQGRFTRIVLDFDRQVPVRTFVERAPARLVVELPVLRVALRDDPLAKPRGLATAFRPPVPAPVGSRAVVELAGPAEFVARFWIPPGQHSPAWRFVVDIEPEGASRPPTAAAPPAEPEPPLPRPRPPGLTTAAAPRAPEPPAVPAEATARPAAAPAAAPAPAVNGLAQPSGRFVVAIDPGHGGTDPGTIGVDGVKEKDLVLAMGLELARALEATGRYEVVLTRRGDEGLALRERIKIARDAGARLFLSLHADSIADPTVAGASVYTLSETASDEEAAALAAKENKADILSGTDLSRHDPIVASILIDLAQRDTLNKSIDFSQILADELAKVTPLLRNHRRFAGFAVLKSPETPSVLIELGYLSNPEEAKRLSDPRHRAKLARAIVAAIDRWSIDRSSGAVK